MKKRTLICFMVLSLVMSLSACTGLGFGGGSGIKMNPAGIATTYTFGGFIVKSASAEDYLADPDTMTTAQKLIYEGYIASFGESIKVTGSEITFYGSLFEEFGAAKFTLSGGDIVFANEEFGSRFSYVTLENGVLSLGMVTGGSGYILEYYSPKYKAPAFKILFNYHGATGGNTAEEHKVQFGKAVGELPVPTRAGYTFSGWRVAESAVILGSDTKYAWKGDIVAVAQWTANSYLAIFNYDGATGGHTTTQKTAIYGAAVGALPAPVKPNFDFDGWFTGISGTGTAVRDTTVWNFAEDMQLYAKWIVAVNYIISFDLSAGIETPPNPQSVSQTAGLTYPPIPERSGFIFGGWYDNPECTGSPFNFAATVTQSRTLFAKWLQPTAEISWSLISVGQTNAVSVRSNNRQYYAFVPLVTQTLTFTVRVTGATTTQYPWIYINIDYSKATNSAYGAISFSVTAGSLYYVGIESYTNNTGSQYVGDGTLVINGTAVPPAGGTRI